LIVEDRFGVRVLERAYRHYAEHMTCSVKYQASCSTHGILALDFRQRSKCAATPLYERLKDGRTG
jgi:hypothetical protein